MIRLPEPLVMGFVLAFVRSGAWVSISPPFSEANAPTVVRAGIAADMALAAAPIAARGPLPGTTPEMIGALAYQAVVGAALGFFIKLAFEAFSTAGSLVDLFSGLDLLPSLDPRSLQQEPIVAQLYHVTALTLLFTTDADLVVVRGFIGSFGTLGVSLASLASLEHAVVTHLAQFFLSAVEMAGPIILVLFLAQVVLALLAKAAPESNVFLLGFPLQILIAILGLGITVVALPGDVTTLMGKAAAAIF
jgi:flagellar biosynthetic protein FliR